MSLDRGVLARIDRKLLAGLGQDESYRMIRVPVTAAKWLTWKRYCDSAGISMGRAIVALIDQELRGVLGDHRGTEEPVFAQRAEQEQASREAAIAIRERALRTYEDRLRARTEHLRRWEDELEAREIRAEQAARLEARRRDNPTKTGRNDRCPCGSGLKYKHCHGLPAR